MSKRLPSWLVGIQTCTLEHQHVHMGVYRQVNAGELFCYCHIFGMVVLCPRLLHSWWISMQCGVVTGTGADMLSHCDEKHSEMMWRECSSCPQRDGKLAVAFVYSRLYFRACVRVCVCILFFSLGAFWFRTPIAWHSNPHHFTRKVGGFACICFVFLCSGEKALSKDFCHIKKSKLTCLLATSWTGNQPRLLNLSLSTGMHCLRISSHTFVAQVFRVFSLW